MANLPLVSVTVNGQVINEFVRGWDVRLGMAMHNIGILDLLYTGPFSSNSSIPVFPEASVITVTYGISPALQVFHGYINHHEVLSDSDSKTPKVTVRYIIIGTSQPFNNESTRSWSSTSASFIARQVAIQNGLRAVVSPTNRELDYWSQSGESDLSLLCDLAEDSGYYFWFDDSSLYFINPDTRLIGPSSAAVPTFLYNRQAGLQDTLVDFSNVVGQNVPGQGIQSNRVTYGWDERTGTPFKYSTAVNAGTTPASTTTPMLSQVTTAKYTRNYGQAKAILNAATSTNRSWLTAKATVIGSNQLHPGCVINLQGNALVPNGVGTWLVEEARHVIVPSRVGSGTTAKYATYLTLTRNAATQVVFSNIYDLSSIGETVPTVLVNGNTWQSSVLQAYLV